jgi:hypothetical protein
VVCNSPLSWLLCSRGATKITFQLGLFGLPMMTQFARKTSKIFFGRIGPDVQTFNHSVLSPLTRGCHSSIFEQDFDGKKSPRDESTRI